MATQQLVLLRHAKSDWFSGANSDFDRPLNKRGRRAAVAMGEWFQENAIAPDLILCSSSERTTETLSLVSSVCRWQDSEIRFTKSLYHASEHDLAALIETTLEDSESLMLVGHNPGLEMLLLCYFPNAPFFSNGKLMPTATAAVIEMTNGVPTELLHLERPAKR